MTSSIKPNLKCLEEYLENTLLQMIIFAFEPQCFANLPSSTSLCLSIYRASHIEV